MNIKKIILLGMLAISGSLYATPNCLVVELKDSTSQSFLLAERPEISFVDSFVVVKGDVEASFLGYQIERFKFIEEPSTNAENLKAAEIRVCYTDNEHISVLGLEPKSIVRLFSTNGKLLATKQEEAGVVSFTLPQAKGIYVLNVNNQSVKIIKK